MFDLRSSDEIPKTIDRNLPSFQSTPLKGKDLRPVLRAHRNFLPNVGR